MAQKLSPLIRFINERLTIFLGISFGVFLFILFFEPFPIELVDFNNRLLYVAGFGAITYFLLNLFWILFRVVSPQKLPDENISTLATYLNEIITLVLISTAITFYLRYVGSVQITFYIVFKVVLIEFGVLVARRIFDANRELRRLNEVLAIEVRLIQKQIRKTEEENLKKLIEFASDNNTENLSLHVSDIIFFKSADNYVEIAYVEGDHIKKKLIRNTLKNIEVQIKSYTNFVRCHRICIVNLLFIDRMTRYDNNHWLLLKGIQDQLPVSRQYLIHLKDVISK